jgi:hypothetical protein
MYQCNVSAPYERYAIDKSRPFLESERANSHLLVIMGCFTEWPEVQAIHNQEASKMADVLVTNFFCRFGVPRVLYSDQGWNFEMRRVPNILRCVGVCRMRTNPLHPQSDGTVESYVKAAEGNLREVIITKQTD